MCLSQPRILCTLQCCKTLEKLLGISCRLHGGTLCGNGRSASGQSLTHRVVNSNILRPRFEWTRIVCRRWSSKRVIRRSCICITKASFQWVCCRLLDRPHGEPRLEIACAILAWARSWSGSICCVQVLLWWLVHAFQNRARLPFQWTVGLLKSLAVRTRLIGARLHGSVLYICKENRFPRICSMTRIILVIVQQGYKNRQIQRIGIYSWSPSTQVR